MTDWTRVEVHPDDASMLPIEAANVARLYRHLAADLDNDSHGVPDFEVAHSLHALVEQIPPFRHARASA